MAKIVNYTDKRTLKTLYDNWAMTWEGLDENDFETALEMCGGENAVGYCISGEDFNWICHLTDNNAYPADLHIFSVYPFKGLAMQFGARWMTDIVDNNARREGYHPFGSKKNRIDASHCSKKKPIIKEQVLTEKKWDYQLETGSYLRELINEDDPDYEAIIRALVDCYTEAINYLESKDEWTEEFDEALEDLMVTFSYDENTGECYFDEDEQPEDAIDYQLDTFYDLCDAYNLWVDLKRDGEFIPKSYYSNNNDVDADFEEPHTGTPIRERDYK